MGHARISTHGLRHAVRAQSVRYRAALCIPHPLVEVEHPDSAPFRLLYRQRRCRGPDQETRNLFVADRSVCGV